MPSAFGRTLSPGGCPRHLSTPRCSSASGGNRPRRGCQCCPVLRPRRRRAFFRRTITLRPRSTRRPRAAARQLLNSWREPSESRGGEVVNLSEPQPPVLVGGDEQVPSQNGVSVAGDHVWISGRAADQAGALGAQPPARRKRRAVGQPVTTRCSARPSGPSSSCGANRQPTRQRVDRRHLVGSEKRSLLTTASRTHVRSHREERARPVRRRSPQTPSQPARCGDLLSACSGSMGGGGGRPSCWRRQPLCPRPPRCM